MENEEMTSGDNCNDQNGMQLTRDGESHIDGRKFSNHINLQTMIDYLMREDDLRPQEDVEYDAAIICWLMTIIM